MIKKIKKIFNFAPKKQATSVNDRIENMFDSLLEDTILIKIGTDIVPFGESIVNLIGILREEIKDECGFIIPPVKIVENNIIQENEYKIYVLSKLETIGFLIPTESKINEELYQVLKTIIYEKINSIFTYEITEKYINTVQKINGLLIWNLTSVLSVMDIKIILSDILTRGKSIHDINYIFEKIGEYILTEGNYHDPAKQFNPHKIAKQIVKNL